MSSTLPDLGRRGEGWVALQGPLFAAVFVAGLFGPAWGSPARLPTAVAGIVLVAAGMLLAIPGVRVPRESLTAFPRPLANASLVASLVDRGAYGLVRHPIHGGLVLGAAGWGLVTASWLAIPATLVPAAFFELKSRREEARLAERYPGYARYRLQTRRLTPWVY